MLHVCMYATKTITATNLIQIQITQTEEAENQCSDTKNVTVNPHPSKTIGCELDATPSAVAKTCNSL